MPCRRRVVLVTTAALTILMVVVVVGMNTNRIYIGAQFRNVEAMPQTHPCGLGDGRISTHVIDVAGRQWYATWDEGFDEMPQAGIMKGTLRVTALPGGPSSAIWGAGSSDDDRAVLNTQDGRYLFKGGWAPSCD